MRLSVAFGESPRPTGDGYRARGYIQGFRQVLDRWATFDKKSLQLLLDFLRLSMRCRWKLSQCGF